MAAHVPLRRCVGCGRVAPKPQLVRMAIAAQRRGAPPSVVIDGNGALPGRGAYVCREAPGGPPKRACLSQALARKAFPRAFRRAVNVPAELVESVGR